MPIRPTTVAIVDDHLLFRKTLRKFLFDKGIDVVVEASTISELLVCLKGKTVEVLLMDVHMPELHGVEALNAIQAVYPDLKVIALSMNTEMEMVSELLDSGIYGYICKVNEPEDLLQAIETAMGGRVYRNKWFNEAVSWKERMLAEAGGSVVVLSDREKKFLQLLWEEKSNKEIADELFLGVKSVEKIKQDLKEKIGVKSTVGLLKYSIDKKIVSRFRDNRTDK